MLSTNLKIRKAVLEECNTIVEFVDTHLHNMYHDAGFLPSSMIRDKIERGNLVVVDSEIGILGVALTNGKTLWNLIVHKEYRNDGIGSTLLKAIDPQFVRIKCSGGMPDPTGFYIKNGYQPIEFVRSKVTKKKTILLAERK